MRALGKFWILSMYFSRHYTVQTNRCADPRPSIPYLAACTRCSVLCARSCRGVGESVKQICWLHNLGASNFPIPRIGSYSVWGVNPGKNPMPEKSARQISVMGNLLASHLLYWATKHLPSNLPKTGFDICPLPRRTQPEALHPTHFNVHSAIPFLPCTKLVCLISPNDIFSEENDCGMRHSTQKCSDIKHAYRFIYIEFLFHTSKILGSRFKRVPQKSQLNNRFPELW